MYFRIQLHSALLIPLLSFVSQKKKKYDVTRNYVHYQIPVSTFYIGTSIYLDYFQLRELGQLQMPLFPQGLVWGYLEVEEKYIQLNKIVSFVRIVETTISYNYRNKLKIYEKHYIREFLLNDLIYVNVSKIIFTRKIKQYVFSIFNTKKISTCYLFVQSIFSLHSF